MFHACFMTIPTCFIHTLCHIYAFSGTNLLTRCRSASSCFAVFCFRNPSKEIFSELDEINAQNLIFPGSFREPERDQRGALGAPHVMAAKPRGARPPSVSPPRRPSDSPSVSWSVSVNYDVWSSFRRIPRILPEQPFWNQKQQKTATGLSASRQ